MDSITQGVLGAAIGEAILGKEAGNKGALAGAIIATIPDLDVVLYLCYDSLDMLSIHRGLSHSILFSVLGALLIAFLLGKMRWFQNISFRRLLVFAWLCLFTHILLDTFTAYGTQLLLPFSNQRLGLDSVNVVDPFYTLPMIIGLVLSLWVYKTKPQRSIFNKWGLVISSLYLVFTLFNKEGVKSAVKANFAQANIEYHSLLTMPVGIANIKWYGVAKGADSIYMQAYSVLSDEDHPIEAFPINEHYLDEIDPEVAEKMRWFAKGFYTVDKINGKIRIYNLQVDMRGIVQTEGKKAPTVGYFELSIENGETVFSSGSIRERKK